MAECTHVAKRDVNNHQRFHFRGIDAVVNAVGPILRKHEVTVRPVVQRVDYDSVQTTNGKSSTACRVIVDYVFSAIDGSEVTATVAAEAWDSGDKAAPKAMSVAFRTALLQTLALPTDEPDPDSHTYEKAPHQQAPAAPPPAPATEAQRKRMHALLGELGITDREKYVALAAWSVGRDIASTSELTGPEAQHFIDYLAKRRSDEQQGGVA